MQLRKLHVGRWVRVKYDDIGVRDGLLIAKDHHSDSKPHMCTVYFLYEGLDTSIEPSQIIAMGDYVEAKDIGIPDFVSV